MDSEEFIGVSSFSRDDIVIMIIGMTGVGKSSFISLLTGASAQIGHGLISCTTKIGIYSFVHENGRTVYLVDTPGFDDTMRSDNENLQDIAFFLAETYSQGIRLLGVIFLHRITDVRMGGSSLKTLTILKEICGEDAYRNILLVTTMWENLPDVEGTSSAGVKRENELIRRKEWWGAMCDRKSRVCRHNGSINSALQIVGYMLESTSTAVLKLQIEMVDFQIPLSESAAGQIVLADLLNFRQKAEEEIARVTSEYEEAARTKDIEFANEILKHKQRVEMEVFDAKKSQEELKISMERLVEKKTAEYKQLLDELEVERGRLEILLRKEEADHERLQLSWRREVAQQREIQLGYEEARSALQRQVDELTAKIMVSRNKMEREQASCRKQDQHNTKELISRLEKERKQVELRAQEMNDEHEVIMTNLEKRQRDIEKQMEGTTIQVTSLKSKLKAAAKVGVPLIGILAGVAMTIAGAVTVNPTLLTGGIAIATAAATSFENVKSKESRGKKE